MSTTEIVTAIFVFSLAGVSGYLSIRHFLERGFLLNNYYIFASKEEREKMDKKPHYRQSAVVFALISLIFLILGLSTVLQNSKLLLLEIPAAAAAIIYAFVSSLRNM